MDKVKPKAQSTPKYLPGIQGRSSIRERTAFSPVTSSPGKSPKQLLTPKTHITGDSDEDSDEDSLENELQEEVVLEEKVPTLESPSKSSNNSLNGLFYILLIPMLVCIVAVSAMLNQTELSSCTNKISELLPEQRMELFSTVAGGVQDVLKLNRPATFILLYEPSKEKTLEHVLTELSNYTLCNLQQCNLTSCSHRNIKPVEIHSSEFLQENVLRDYGIIIDKYQEKILQNGIVIIKNIDKIPGRSAQVLHTFCDEYSPMAERAVYFFTIKVDKLPENPLQYVESILERAWNDLEADKLQPLIARVTGRTISIK